MVSDEEDADLTPDQMIRQMYMRCHSVTGLQLSFLNNRGWVMTARCEHGTWCEQSGSPVHLQRGIRKLYGVFMKEHPQPVWD